MSHLAWLLKPPYIFLIIGFIFFSAGVASTLSGRVWVRFSGWVYRSEEPKWFWWEVALDYAVGVFFIGWCLYKVSRF